MEEATHISSPTVGPILLETESWWGGFVLRSSSPLKEPTAHAERDYLGARFAAVFGMSLLRGILLDPPSHTSIAHCQWQVDE